MSYKLSQKNKITRKEAEALVPDTSQKLIDQREKNIPTITELYDKVETEYVNKFSDSIKREYYACFKRLSPIHNPKINSVSLNEPQEIIDDNKNKVSKNIRQDKTDFKKQK